MGKRLQKRYTVSHLILLQIHNSTLILHINPQLIRTSSKHSDHSEVSRGFTALGLDALMTFKELGFSHSISVLGTGVQVLGNFHTVPAVNIVELCKSSQHIQMSPLIRYRLIEFDQVMAVTNGPKETAHDNPGVW